ncbi:hypothetical protein SDC9_123478 [bioreactor metagenome]|uniref:Uncharacterized protein n=1 Tax=bioreactor metagenome TaxID=1076179 RepID=A0A645CHR0_9ZZZZ
MFNKKTIVTEILFLFLIAATSLFYIEIGQWKAHVQLFGITEIIILLVTLLIFAVRIIKKCPISHTLLLFLYGILCAMQMFPMIGALILGIYYKVALIHLITIIMGTFNIVVLTRLHRNLV